MNEKVNVQYVGFEAKALVREYRFIVRRALNETSEFTLTIETEAFGSRLVRYQDAPEICSFFRPESHSLHDNNNPSSGCGSSSSIAMYSSKLLSGSSRKRKRRASS